MQSLSEMQQTFLQDILRGETASAGKIAADGLDGAARMQVYRNNTRLILTGVLAGIYPVFYKLVGERFFNGTAREYLHVHTPDSGNMHAYGAEMADFLEGFPPAQQLPYLPDVARLEWAWHSAYYAADVAPELMVRHLPAKDLAKSNADIGLHPSCTVLASPYPVHRIWEVNRNNHDETVSLEEGEVLLLVVRAGGEVLIWPLLAEQHRCLEALASGEDFGKAIAHLDKHGRDTNNGFLGQLMARGVLVKRERK